MKDRAMQALHLLALSPISEVTADRNSYGFRPKRSTADAIQQCFIVLAQKKSARWILEADIKACFDKISHQWLLDHTLMDKNILKQWLSAGYMEKQVLMPTQEGTPQGGIISPTLANLALDGLERLTQKISKDGDKIHVVRYADDFIITGNSKELLERKVKPAIEEFLHERGLTFSKEKTKITHITDGFYFFFTFQ
jgi:RNA-directed DNA polymerase